MIQHEDCRLTRPSNATGLLIDHTMKYMEANGHPEGNKSKTHSYTLVRVTEGNDVIYTQFF